MRLLEIDRNTSTGIEEFVTSVVDNTPSLSDMRFAEQVLGHGGKFVPTLAKSMQEAPGMRSYCRGCPRLMTWRRRRFLRSFWLTARVG